MTTVVSDEAVQAAANGAHQELLSMASEMRLPMKYTESISVGNYRVMRSAITAALPHLQPVDVAAVRRQAFEEVVTELEVNWPHRATPEMRDAIRALSPTEPAQD